MPKDSHDDDCTMVQTFGCRDKSYCDCGYYNTPEEIIEGTGVPKLVLGQKLYIPCIRERIVVEAIIEELHDIYLSPEGKTIWHSYDIDGRNDARTSINEVDENGWNKTKSYSVEDLVNRKLHNQFPWTSFPTWGHAAYIGDYAFVTLQEARGWIRPSNKKHLVRRLKAATKYFRKDFPNYQLKSYKIFVRNY